jgi:DNA-binding response OmpR family regulator
MSQYDALLTADSALLVDDDEIFAAELVEYLGSNGLRATHSKSLTDIGSQLNAVKPRILILDQFLADIDTLTVLRDVRKQFTGGLVVLTGNQEQEDRVIGLELGADDFISKTQPAREILARLRAVLRRMSRQAAQPQPPTHPQPPSPPAPAVIDRSLWNLNVPLRQLRSPAGTLVRLTATEYDLFAYLKAREGVPVSRDDLSRAVLRREFTVFDRSLDNLVGSIRRALKPFGAETAIQSIRGVGYVFVGFPVET